MVDNKQQEIADTIAHLIGMGNHFILVWIDQSKRPNQCEVIASMPPDQMVEILKNEIGNMERHINEGKADISRWEHTKPS